jgi:hypothetical protein
MLCDSFNHKDEAQTWEGIGISCIRSTVRSSLSRVLGNLSTRLEDCGINNNCQRGSARNVQVGEHPYDKLGIINALASIHRILNRYCCYTVLGIISTTLKIEYAAARPSADCTMPVFDLG